jgi:hypothetical protein
MRYDVIDQIAGRAVLTGQGSLACAERIFLTKRRWLDLGASRPEREVGSQLISDGFATNTAVKATRGCWTPAGGHGLAADHAATEYRRLLTTERMHRDRLHDLPHCT